MGSIKFKLRYFVAFVIAFVGSFYQGLGQEISIELGPDEIGENQAWTITVTVKNERLKSYDDFPDIEGFQKRGTSSSSSTQIINGQVSSSQSITMNYAPTRQGTFTLPSFRMKINDKVVGSEGKQIKVGNAVQRQQRRDPFRSLFDHSPFGEDEKETEFVDIKEDAFFALTTNKDKIYAGEGVTTTLSFYVSDNNRAPLQFHELGKQLSEILKQVRPENCWEENFNIENINGESVNINGKRYTQYKVYQGVFYPFNAEDIIFPQVGLEMIKYKVAKNPSFFGRNRQEDFKTFYTQPKTIKVVELPPHPLRDQVAVGDYLLDERVSTNELETGKSFSYEFNIYGEGNISAVAEPKVDGGDNFDFYDPNVTQNINRRNGRVTGSKSYAYFGIPKEPGEYGLGDYFEWVFFNPRYNKYDTLRSSKKLIVSGESMKNEAIQSNDLGNFYDRIAFEDNKLTSTNQFEWIKIIANILILGMLGFSGVFIFGSDIKNSFKDAADFRGERPSFSIKNALKSSLVISILIGLVITILITGTQILPTPELSYILQFIIYFILIPVAIFRLSIYMRKRNSSVTAGRMYLRAFIIAGTYYFMTNSLSVLSDNYERFGEYEFPFSGNLLSIVLLLSIAHFFVFFNSVLYFFHKNDIAIWKAFIPFKNLKLMGKVAGYDMKWYRFLIPWPPFKMMKEIATTNGKSTALGYACAILPFIFYPFLLHDNK